MPKIGISQDDDDGLRKIRDERIEVDAIKSIEHLLKRKSEYSEDLQPYQRYQV